MWKQLVIEASRRKGIMMEQFNQEQENGNNI